jgi:hypothetical protein
MLFVPIVFALVQFQRPKMWFGANHVDSLFIRSVPTSQMIMQGVLKPGL